jgi:hypothetical protein
LAPDRLEKRLKRPKSNLDAIALALAEVLLTSSPFYGRILYKTEYSTGAGQWIQTVQWTI